MQPGPEGGAVVGGQVDDLVRRPVDGVRRAETDELLGGLVEVGDRAVGVDCHQRLAHARDHRLETATETDLGGRLVLDALGHRVERGAEDADLVDALPAHPDAEAAAADAVRRHREAAEPGSDALTDDGPIPASPLRP